MNNLFDRAKQIGLDHLREWLPDGRQDGDEWIALNPTRADKTAGSFKVNLKTGAWLDNATNDRGGDSVSLYAFINLDACTLAASNKGYRNLDGGIQAEAARMILEAHDPSYFPGSEDDFTPRNNKKGDNWEGWFPCKSKIEPLPRLNTSFYEKLWGKDIERWEFLQGNKTIMFVVRFVEGKTKNDRPFTLWQKGGEYKWRSKAPEDRYPLWNLPELEARPGDAIILCEGQKAASRGKECQGLKEYVFSGWYGGAKNTRQTEWSSLRGRTVHFWPDSDTPGRQAIKDLRELATQYDINLSVISTPVGVAKGWDLADAISEGRDIKDIIEPSKKDHAEGSHFLDDMPMPFEIMGTSGTDIIFYSHASNRIERYGASALTKFKLMTLAPREIWGEYYAKDEGGIAWDAAIDDIIQNGAKKPIFDWTRVRGAGAWIDGADTVLNTGEYLLIDGERKELHQRVGKYVYEKQAKIPYRIDDTLSLEQSANLLDCLNTIGWTLKAAPYALAGWVLLSAWGGLLRWRPHVWLVGPSGTGKSWIMEKVIYPIAVDGFGIKGDGWSTMAGVRQSLHNSAKCFMGDEMESDNKKNMEQIEQIVSLFRGSSSGQNSGGITLHGSQDGEGKQWVMQSMACFASVGADIKHSADANRFTVCELKRNRAGIDEHKANFSVIEKKSRIFTSEYSRAFHARTYSLIGEVLKAISIMKEQASKILGTMRDGDQIGTLMAGSWMVEHDEAPTAAEAYAYLREVEIEKLKEGVEMKSDEEICLDEILAIKVELSDKAGRSKMTVGNCLELWYGQVSGLSSYESQRDDYPGISQVGIRRELEQIGLRPVYEKGENLLYVATAHPALQKLLRDTGWSSSYSSLLARLEGYQGTRGPTSFAGIKKRFLEIKIDDSSVPF